MNGQFQLKLLVWHFSVEESSPRCIHHDKLLLNSTVKSADWATVLVKRVDDTKFLLFLRYENGRQAILYQPVIKQVAPTAQYTPSIDSDNVVWSAILPSSITALEPLTAARTFIASSNDAVYIYDLHSGTILHTMKLDFMVTIHHILGSICTLENEGMHKAITLDVLRKDAHANSAGWCHPPETTTWYHIEPESFSSRLILRDYSHS
jgi:hypothetical protein